ncbi:MAG: 2-C-methyl-D-erythritol 4-phosphate cytidylyltransferase [Desulfitobacteriia bacterium]
MRSTLSARIGAVIPAAGQGKRMGGQGNKLLLELAGAPILLYTLRTFQACPLIEKIVIPTAARDIPVIEKLVADQGLNKVSAVITGGQERQESVARALQALDPALRRVVVHDGARPLLTVEELNSFLEKTADLRAAVPAVPVKDTIKIINDRGWVVETPLRSSLRAIQTPQVFNRDLLEKVHKLAKEEGYQGTDDASLMEWQGYKVKTTEGSYENIKITTPEDLLLAEAILCRRREKGLRI